MNRRLGGRIGKHARQRIQAGSRTEIDDAAGAALNHVLAENLAGEHETLQVYRNNSFKFFLRNIKKWRGGIDARAVHQNVRLAKFGDDISQKSLEAAFAGR